MRIVAFGQQKGGVGKSSTAINLACQAVAAGESAVIVDMDSDQGTSTLWGKRRKVPPFVVPSTAPLLPDVLAGLRKQKVRWAFLDLPGRHSSTSGAGLVASHLILIPCRPLDVDVEASAATVHAARGARKRFAYLMSIVPGQADKSRARAVADILTNAGVPVCPVMISQNILVPDAIAAGKGINEYAPASTTEFEELFQWLKRTVK